MSYNGVKSISKMHSWELKSWKSHSMYVILVHARDIKHEKLKLYLLNNKIYIFVPISIGNVLVSSNKIDLSFVYFIVLTDNLPCNTKCTHQEATATGRLLLKSAAAGLMNPLWKSSPVMRVKHKLY